MGMVAFQNFDEDFWLAPSGADVFSQLSNEQVVVVQVSLAHLCCFKA